MSINYDGGYTTGYSLFLEEVHQLNLAILAEIALQLLLVERIEVLDVADVDIACSSCVHCEGECWRERSRVLAPADLQPAVVESEALVRRDLVERKRRGRVDESYELFLPSEN